MPHPVPEMFLRLADKPFRLWALTQRFLVFREHIPPPGPAYAEVLVHPPAGPPLRFPVFLPHPGPETRPAEPTVWVVPYHTLRPVYARLCRRMPSFLLTPCNPIWRFGI